MPSADQHEAVGRVLRAHPNNDQATGASDDEPTSLFTDGSASTASSDKRDRDPPDAYRKALGLLVRREHSRRELRRKLDAKGADATEAETALDTLTEQGYQNDARFADMLVRTRIGGGYGPLRIRAELGTHGIDETTIAAALDEAEPDWPELAIDALRRRYGARAAKDIAERIKRSQYLMRRGFDGDSIRAALKHDFDD